MPYSVIFKFPEIIQNLKINGYLNEVGIEALKTEMMRVTGSTKDATISNNIRAMVRLGYLEEGQPGRFIIKKVKAFETEEQRRERIGEKK